MRTRSLPVVRVYDCHDEVHYVLRRADGTPLAVSAWMTRPEAAHAKIASAARRREDWAVLILEHHQGYIDWDAYQSNQTMIAHNDNAMGNAVRGSIKHGEAILAGLLRCGHCGARVLAQYPGPGAIRYQCSGYLLNRDRACCVIFGGLRADRSCRSN